MTVCAYMMTTPYETTLQERGTQATCSRSCFAVPVAWRTATALSAAAAERRVVCRPGINSGPQDPSHCCLFGRLGRSGPCILGPGCRMEGPGRLAFATLQPGLGRPVPLGFDVPGLADSECFSGFVRCADGRSGCGAARAALLQAGLRIFALGVGWNSGVLPSPPAAGRGPHSSDRF